MMTENEEPAGTGIGVRLFPHSAHSGLIAAALRTVWGRYKEGPSLFGLRTTHRTSTKRVSSENQHDIFTVPRFRLRLYRRFDVSIRRPWWRDTKSVPLQ